MSKPRSPRAVRATLAKLTDREQAKLVRHGFGPMLGLQRLASQRDGAVLVDSVLALHTQTGRRPPRPEDEANAAEVKRRQRRLVAEINKGGEWPGRPPMGLTGVLLSWAAIWGIAVVLVPLGMLVMTVTAEWVYAVVMIGTFIGSVVVCGVIATRGHFQAWTAVLPILLVLIGVVGATSPLYLKYEGRDERGELVRAWTTNPDTKMESRHCLLAWDDAGVRREVRVNGCPDRFFKESAPALGEHVPVRFVLSPGAVKSRVGTRAGQATTWQEAVAGTGLVLLAALTAWGVSDAVRRRRVSRPASAAPPATRSGRA